MTSGKALNRTLATAGALADGSRVRVVMALKERAELCVCQIVELLGLAPATVSRHMSVLQGGGFVDSRKEGRWVYYRISKEAPRELLRWLEGELSGNDQIAADRAELDDILNCELSELCSARKSRQDDSNRRE